MFAHTHCILTAVIVDIAFLLELHNYPGQLDEAWRIFLSKYINSEHLTGC
jgi:hypothetical protein